MTIIDTLVTDRTVRDIKRIATLHAKPLNQWTAEESSYYAHGDEKVLYASDTVLVAIDGEITVYEGVVRGSYNADDLNRVGAAVQYLRERLYTLAGEVVDVTAKSDWTESDIPTEGDMEAYLADIAAIRGALDVPETVPQVPEWTML